MRALDRPATLLTLPMTQVVLSVEAAYWPTPCFMPWPLGVLPWVPARVPSVRYWVSKAQGRAAPRACTGQGERDE
jgi:hypothetical protein